MNIQNGKFLEEFGYMGDTNIIGFRKNLISDPKCRRNKNRVNFTWEGELIEI